MFIISCALSEVIWLAVTARCRALIPATSIKPLDASPKTLSLKRTVGFMKACKELGRHQDLLKHSTNSLHDDDNQSGGDNDCDDDQVTYLHLNVNVTIRVTEIPQIHPTEQARSSSYASLNIHEKTCAWFDACNHFLPADVSISQLSSKLSRCLEWKNCVVLFWLIYSNDHDKKKLRRW